MSGAVWTDDPAWYHSSQTAASPQALRNTCNGITSVTPLHCQTSARLSAQKLRVPRRAAAPPLCLQPVQTCSPAQPPGNSQGGAAIFKLLGKLAAGEASNEELLPSAVPLERRGTEAQGRVIKWSGVCPQDGSKMHS